MNEYLIIVAGGTGTRINSDVPKQYLLLNNTPIIIHSINRFLSYNKSIRIICCVHKDYIKHAQDLMSEYFSAHKIIITEGGETRFHSVKNGLKLIQDNNSVVAIHDAARPLVSIGTIKRCFDSARNFNSGVPVIKMNESIRITEGEKNKSVDRNNYRIVQTPQCFSTNLLQQAFMVAYKEIFTDDATVFENAEHSITLVEGNSENTKITLPIDIAIAEVLLKNVE